MPNEANDWDESWRAACREVLRLRRLELEREKPSRGLSWQGVRDEIMSAYDRYDGKRRTYEDKRLRRQDLANYVEHEKRIKADKFRFIDRYVRELDVLGTSDTVRKVLRHQTASDHLRTLSSMYGVSNISRQGVMQVIRGLKKYVYAKDMDDDPYRGLFLAVDFVSEHGASVIIGYCPRTIPEMQVEDSDGVVFFSAYLIPMGFDRALEEHTKIMEKTSHLSISDLKCVIKAFRPEFRGLQAVGYADGEAKLFNFSDHMYGFQDGQEYNSSSLTLDYPNSISSPFSDNHHRPQRYVMASAVQRDKTPWPSDDEEDGGMSTSSNTDFFDTETWRIEMRSDKQFDSVIENIIESSYKGYLF